MLSLSKSFKRRKNLIIFITAGDPSLAVTERLIYQLEKAGADIIELGIPFSDPLADGPVIQASHLRALKNDVSISDVFKLVKNIRKKTEIPICFMLSYNLILKYGIEKFYQDAALAKVDGVIVPDLPPEETTDQRPQTTDQNKKVVVDTIFLIAPTSTNERIKMATEKSSGFIYMVSVAGITGKRSELSKDLSDIIARIRHYTQLPIAVGFGISNPKQAAEIAKIADGVIVGSAIVDLIGKKKIAAVPKFVKSLRSALDVK